MAKNKDIKDMATALGDMLSSVDQISDKIASSFEKSASKATDLTSILEKMVAYEDDAAKGAKTVKGLMEKMNKDAKVMESVTKSVNKIRNEELKKYWGSSLSILSKQLSLIKDKEKRAILEKIAVEKLSLRHKEITDSLKLQVALQKKAAEEGQKRRDGLFSRTVDFTKDFKSASGILGKLKVMKETLKTPQGFAVVFFGVSALSFLAAVKASVDLISASFKEMWDFLDKKVIPSNAKLNKQFGDMGGNLGHVKSAAVSAGIQFEMLGLSFEQGANAVGDFMAGLMRLPNSRKEMKELAQTGLKLSEYVGLGAEAAGRLALVFEKSEGDLRGLNSAMKDSVGIAANYNVPVNQIRKDMGESLDILARFGTKNRMVFLESAAKARSYGLTIKDIDASFGKQMSTFEGTSEAAAKLNTVFGTQINSYKLMLQTDPVKRMEMLRKELDRQGKSWDKLNEFEKNALTSTLQISEEKAALAFSSEKVRKKLEAEANQQKKNVKIQQDWDKALSKLRSTLLPLAAIIDNFLRSFGNWFSKMLGFDNAAKAIKSSASMIEQFFGNLTKYFGTKQVNGANTIATAFQEISKTITSEKFANSVGAFLEALPTAMAKLAPFLVDKLPYLLELIEKIMVKVAGFLGITPDQALFGGAVKPVMLKPGEKAAPLNMDQQIKKGGFGQALLRKALQPIFGAPAQQYSIEKANDALITKHGQIVKFNPQDNIIATKKSMSPRTVGGGDGGNVRVEVVAITLDGKKVGEAQVRISRQ